MDITEKSIELIQLYDIYQNLLTEKQREYFESYYYDDLSITEISENRNVSRNAVHDQIKKTAIKLNDLENKLKVKFLSLRRNEIYVKIKTENNKEKINLLVEELEKVE